MAGGSGGRGPRPLARARSSCPGATQSAGAVPAAPTPPQRPSSGLQPHKQVQACRRFGVVSPLRSGEPRAVLITRSIGQRPPRSSQTAMAVVAAVNLRAPAPPRPQPSRRPLRVSAAATGLVSKPRLLERLTGTTPTDPPTGVTEAPAGRAPEAPVELRESSTTQQPIVSWAGGGIFFW